ncbi:hypothetical protein DL95DRAFT_434513 [Leptodontidium sp. 2 PMI_412]|nr:hypothetical protein DL95DRAFT_434513 [Leptodontidium sp. 2 PMI_412]
MAPSRWRILEGCNVAINHLGLERDEVHKISLFEEAAAIKAEKVEGETTSKAGDLFEIAGDVTKPETGTILVEKAVEKWGKLDIFVANAGVFEPAEFLTLDPELFDRTVKINLNGAFYTCQAAARQMVKQGHGGSIIGISSISALVGGGLQTHYTPTKAGVLSLIQSMAISLGKDNIRCNAILPGTIKTQLSEEDMKNDVKRNYLEARIPMGRVGDTKDIAGPALFLASEELSPYCNGTQLLSDGGMYEHPQKLDAFDRRSQSVSPFSSTHSMADEERPAPPKKPRNRQSRGKGLRKTTGCITCRRRHVKCDENRPHCDRCRKGNQTCIYADPHGAKPPPSPPSVNRQPSAPLSEAHLGRLSDLQQRTPSVPPWPNSPEQAMVFQAGQPAPSEAGRASITSVPSDRHNSQSSLGQRAPSQIDYLLNAPSLPPDTPQQQIMSPELSSHNGASFSLKSGEQNAVARPGSSQPTFNVAISRWFDMLVGDSVFENGIPDIDPGMDDGYNMGTSREQNRTSFSYIGSFQGSPADGNSIQGASPCSSSSPQLLERNFSMNSIAEKVRWQAPAPIELSQYELFIFRNFVQRISLWIDLFDPTQSFSTFVPHLALRNVGLMKAILALSARHISLNPGIAAERPNDRNDALQYYNETLHYLSKAMQYESYKTSLELLATALIVSTYEMLDGSGKDWERHLQGVFWIQRSQVIHGDSKGLKQAVWWAWLCQDVWAAFQEKRKTFTFWKPARTFADMSPYELASRAVYIIAKVVNYCSREESEGGDLALRIENGGKLQDMLDEWERFLTTEFTPLPYKSESEHEAFQPIWIHTPAFGVAMQLHYSARLLLLLNKPSKGGFGGYLEQSRMISRYVNNICGIAMTLSDSASSVMCSQCLYIAGMCIQDSRQRQAVLQMIDACRRRSGWPVISLGDELQAFWDNSAATPGG